VKRNLGFTVLFPEGRAAAELRNASVLILLHGYAGNQFDWLLGSEVARHAQERGLVVVLPSGENHFYLDDDEMEELFAQWIVDELPETVSAMFGIAWARERWYLGGYSMGGYGALRNGLAFPGRFGGVIGLSSALITRSIASLQPGERTPYAGYGYYRRVFGDLTTLVGSDRDPEALVTGLVARGVSVPRLYLACGTEDFLLEDNRSFRRCLERLGVAHHAVEPPGGHDFAFWNAQLTPALDWMLQGLVR
jgi:S-formylglutathione hydrolase FrmB